MGDEVRVVYRKFDGSLHWHLTMRWLGEDDHGRWLGAGPGYMRKGDGPPVAIRHAHVALFPHDAWWTAWFNAKPAKVDVYVDVTTPPVWRDRAEVGAIDLDLDVCRVRRFGRSGRIELLDEDEFATHQVRYGYPPEVIAQARGAADFLFAALRRRDEPFVTAYRPWLARVA